MKDRAIYSSYYQVGGSLPPESPAYVKRRADDLLYEYLKAGRLCYVFNSRQMGKSSLQLQAKRRLESEGFVCALIDLSIIGEFDITPNQLYIGLIKKLVKQLGLSKQIRQSELNVWWTEHSQLSPLQRLEEFVDQVILTKKLEKIVIFIDEVDKFLSFSFLGDDFFSFIRACHNKRAVQADYARITFALFGVATPNDLVQDKAKAPFNLGQPIELTGFTLEEAQSALLPGLEKSVDAPLEVLEEILTWTGGQPFLTQKLCDLVIQNAIKGPPDVAQIVHTYIIENWEAQDAPQHLKTIRNRLLKHEKQAVQLLSLYQKVLEDDGVLADNSYEQQELRLSGLVVKRQNKLCAYNRIYKLVFNQSWIAIELARLRPYADSINAWLASDCQDESRLLRGKALEDALAWARRQKLSDRDRRFLSASQEYATATEKQKNQILRKANHYFRVASAVLVVALLSSFTIGGVILHRSYEVNRDRNIQTLLRVVDSAQGKFDQGQQLEALQLSLEIAQSLKTMLRREQISDERISQILITLQRILTQTRIKNHFTDVRSTSVNSASFSPDGQWLAIASQDNTVRLWNLQDYSDVRLLTEHEGFVYNANFSPDGQWLATASRDGTARLWNLQDGSSKALKGHSEDVYNVSFHPSRRLLATASLDGTARLWNFQGDQLEEFKITTSKDQACEHQSEESDEIPSDPGSRFGSTAESSEKPSGIQTYDVSFRPHRPWLATASRDGCVRLWDYSRGVFIRALKVPVTDGSPSASSINPIYDIAFSSGGTSLAIASRDGGAQVWDVMTNTFHKLPSLQGEVSSVDFGGGHTMLATTSEGNIVTLWNLTGPTKIRQFTLPEDTVYDARFSTDGQRLVTGSTGGDVWLWDLTDRLNEGFNIREWGRITSADFNHSRTLVAAGFRNGSVRHWDLQGNLISSLESESREPIIDVAFSPSEPAPGGGFDGQIIATASRDGAIRFWELNGEKPFAEFRVRKMGEQSLAFSPDGQQLAAIWDDATIGIWNLQGQKLNEFDLQDYHDDITQVSFSPDEKQAFLVVASRDGTVSLWPIQGTQPKALSRGGDGEVRDISISPDGAIIAIASDNGAIRLWQWERNKTLQKFDINENRELKLQRFFWFGQRQQTLGIQENAPAVRVRFSPDGKELAAASQDGEILLWNIEEDQLIQQLQAPDDETYGMEFSRNEDADAFQLLTASKNGAITLWQVEEELADLDKFLKRGCEKLAEHLKYLTSQDESDANQGSPNIFDICKTANFKWNLSTGQKPDYRS